MISFVYQLTDSDFQTLDDGHMPQVMSFSYSMQLLFVFQTKLVIGRRSNAPNLQRSSLFARWRYLNAYDVMSGANWTQTELGELYRRPFSIPAFSQVVQVHFCEIFCWLNLCASAVTTADSAKYNDTMTFIWDIAITQETTILTISSHIIGTITSSFKIAPSFEKFGFRYLLRQLAGGCELQTFKTTSAKSTGLYERAAYVITISVARRQLTRLSSI